MTNDIKDIRNKYLKDEDEKQRKNTEHDAITKISGGSKPTRHCPKFCVNGNRIQL